MSSSVLVNKYFQSWFHLPFPVCCTCCWGLCPVRSEDQDRKYLSTDDFPAKANINFYFLCLGLLPLDIFTQVSLPAIINYWWHYKYWKLEFYTVLNFVIVCNPHLHNIGLLWKWKQNIEILQISIYYGRENSSAEKTLWTNA